MIDLGSTEFVLAIPSRPEAELRRLSSSLFDSWEAYVGSSVSIPDYSLFLEIEEGSIKGRTTIAAAATALYVGIGLYGDFVSGLKTIHEQVSATSDYVTKQATRSFSCPPSSATTTKRGGSLGALHRLFVKVQRGELTPEDAMLRAEKILGEDAATEPGLMKNLVDALQNCPRYHQQSSLPFSDYPEESDAIQGPIPKTPRPSKPSPPVLGPPLHLRVEVWRESKSKRKQTRIFKL